MSLGRLLEAHVEKELGGSMAIEGPYGPYLSYLRTSQRWLVSSCGTERVVRPGYFG